MAAFEELQVNTDAPPAETIFGAAVRVAVGATLTVTLDAALVPAGPVQVREYCVLEVIAPVLWAPLVGRVPLHPPLAVHDAALDEVQLSCALAPLATASGFAVSFATGITSTVTLAAALVPPGPVQVSEYCVLETRAPVLCEPLVDLAPLQPPEAAQPVAFVECHVNVAAAPF